VIPRPGMMRPSYPLCSKESVYACDCEGGCVKRTDLNGFIAISDSLPILSDGEPPYRAMRGEQGQLTVTGPEAVASTNFALRDSPERLRSHDTQGRRKLGISVYTWRSL
jgi:hypothetical protein